MLKVRLIKSFRHGMRIFEVGEVGEVVGVDYPLLWRKSPVYEHYVKFADYPAVGVLKHEAELLA